MKTYILGDIHGEYNGCFEILHSSGLIDESGHWKGSLGHTLIQLGDIVDRGDEPVKAFMLLRELQKEAAAQGGKVVRLLGNHELSYIDSSKITGGTSEYFLADMIKSDIIDGGITAAHRLDDWTVVHAGILPHISKGMDIDELIGVLNGRLVDAVRTEDYSDEIFFVGPSRGGYKLPGIFWADYYLDLIDLEEELIKQVVGHTPPYGKAPGLNISPGGRIIDADIGICAMYGGNRGILVYEDNEYEYEYVNL